METCRRYRRTKCVKAANYFVQSLLRLLQWSLSARDLCKKPDMNCKQDASISNVLSCAGDWLGSDPAAAWGEGDNNVYIMGPDLADYDLISSGGRLGDMCESSELMSCDCDSSGAQSNRLE